MRSVIALTVPCAVLLYLAGNRIGQFLYGYGASSSAQGQAVGKVASMFALGLPAFSMFYVLLRSYYARENTRTPFLINAGFNVLHLTLGTFLFIRVGTENKVAALALAYSISYIAVWIFTWRLVSKQKVNLNTASQIRLLVRVSVAALISLGLSWTATQFISTVTPENALGGFIQLSAMAATFIGAYYFCAKQMQISEVSDFAKVIRR
jgi:putative peptidoglycan lipid II flippase